MALKSAVIFLLLLDFLMASLFMERKAERTKKCLELINPRQDALAVLLLDGNLERIFVDVTQGQVRWIQIVSSSRSLFDWLKTFDRNNAKTVYRAFRFPDGSEDSRVRAIQVTYPSDAHLFCLLRRYQPNFKHISWTGASVKMRFCKLSAELEEIIIRMFYSELGPYSELLDDYLESQLTEIPYLDSG